jgi:hypothetical protein
MTPKETTNDRARGNFYFFRRCCLWLVWKFLNVKRALGIFFAFHLTPTNQRMNESVAANYERDDVIMLSMHRQTRQCYRIE